MAKFPKETKSVDQGGALVKMDKRLAMGIAMPELEGSMGVRAFDNPNGDSAKPMPVLTEKVAKEEI